MYLGVLLRLVLKNVSLINTKKICRLHVKALNGFLYVFGFLHRLAPSICGLVKFIATIATDVGN